MKVRRPERPIDPADWQRQMNLRLRAEFIAGAEEDSRKRLGRGLTAEELERVLRWYPGDVSSDSPRRTPSTLLSCLVALRAPLESETVVHRPVKDGVTPWTRR